MKLKNSALQELYDTIVNGAIAISVYKDSPIDKGFRECDEKLSESCTFEHINYLQERNDDLERSNKALLEANLNLSTEKGYLKNRIEQLEKELNYFMQSRDDWWRKAKHAKETLNKANADREEQQKNLDYYFNKYRELKKDYETVMKERDDLSKKVVDLKARLNRVYRTITCTPEDYHKDGMYEVWRKLREVADATS